jgi:hypothetical protein
MVKFNLENKTIIPTTREYLFALVHHPFYVEKLHSQKEKYAQLFQWLTDGQDIQAEAYILPTLKEIAANLNISNKILRRQIWGIYGDIMELNYYQPALFISDNDILCKLIFGGLGDSQETFHLGLRVIPRLHEQFVFDFIEPRLGTNRFYIKRIYHHMYLNVQIVKIYLDTELPNQYFELIAGKAFYEKLLSSNDYLGFEKQSIIEEKLRRLGTKI